MAQSAAAIARLDSVRFRMAQCARENKLPRIADFYLDDATINGYDVKLSGKEAIKKYWADINGKGVDWQWEINGYSGNDIKVTQTGVSYLTLAYGQREITYSTSFTVIWEKQQDGSYGIKSDSYQFEGQTEVTPKKFVADSVFIVTAMDTIFGLLLKPILEANQKIPAMLCLQGGGDVGLSNYLYEAEFFAKQGIASLICDKAGAGKSHGKSSWVSQTFEQKVEEYNQLLDWLAKQPFVDKTKIGISGLSEGGRLSLAVALKYPKKIAFVNSVSGPLLTFKDNQLYAIEQLLRARSYNEAVTKQTIQIFDEYFEAVAKGSIPSSLVDRIVAMRSNYPDLYLPPGSSNLPRTPQRADVHYMLGGSRALSDLKCPVLFQYGEEDVIVSVKASVAMIPSQRNIEIRKYKETDHSMNMRNGEVHPRYLLDKMEWLRGVLNP